MFVDAKVKCNIAENMSKEELFEDRAFSHGVRIGRSNSADQAEEIDSDNEGLSATEKLLSIVKTRDTLANSDGHPVPWSRAEEDDATNTQTLQSLVSTQSNIEQSRSSGSALHAAENSQHASNNDSFSSTASDGGLVDIRKVIEDFKLQQYACGIEKAAQNVVVAALEGAVRETLADKCSKRRSWACWAGQRSSAVLQDEVEGNNNRKSIPTSDKDSSSNMVGSSSNEKVLKTVSAHNSSQFSSAVMNADCPEFVPSKSLASKKMRPDTPEFVPSGSSRSSDTQEASMSPSAAPMAFTHSLSAEATVFKPRVSRSEPCLPAKSSTGTQTLVVDMKDASVATKICKMLDKSTNKNFQEESMCSVATNTVESSFTERDHQEKKKMKHKESQTDREKRVNKEVNTEGVEGEISREDYMDVLTRALQAEVKLLLNVCG